MAIGTRKTTVAATNGKNRKSGIDPLGDVPWGTHICQFYQEKRELIGLLVPYFRAGLENNEFCLWITADLPGEQEAERAMGDALPDFCQRFQTKGLMGIGHAGRFFRDGSFNLPAILGGQKGKVSQALNSGLDGVRVAVDLAWLEKKNWNTSASHEEQANGSICGQPALSVCSYPLAKCGPAQVLDVVRNHQYTLIKKGDQWELLEDQGRRAVEIAAMPVDDHGFQALLEGTLDGMLVVDVETMRIIMANQAAAEILGVASAADASDVDPLELVHLEDRDRFVAIIAGDSVRKSGCQVIELRVVTREGRETWINGRGTRTEYQGRLMGLVSMRDITAQKLAEKRLRTSEEERRLLLDNAGVAILVVQDGKIKSANPRAARLSGYSQDELISRPFTEFFHPDDQRAATEAYLAVVAGNEIPHGLVSRYKTKHGKIMRVELTAVSLTLEGKSAIWYFLNDVTERQRAEESLRESDKRYRVLAENVSDVIWVTDTNLRTLYFSPSVTNLLGYSADEAISRALDDNLLPTSLMRVTEALAEAIAMEKNSPGEAIGLQRLELEFRCKNGSTTHVDTALTFRRDSDGRPVGFLGILHDVGERRKADDTLRKSEERFRHLVETTTDWAWEVDRKGVFTYVSPRIHGILGYKPEEVTGKSFFDIMPLTEANRMIRIFDEALATRKPFTFVEFSYLHKDRHTVIMETSAVPFFDAHGNVDGYRGAARDITQRKTAEAELRLSFMKLKEGMEATTQAMALTVELKDPYTAGHQRRTTRLACSIAREMNLPDEKLQAIKIAGLLHDLGKIFIPTEILTKPGGLTGIEFALVKAHPQAGYNVLKNIEFPWPIAQIVLQHHERVNGSGYPSGLQGGETLLEAKILAVSDVFEAMSSYRPYRRSLGLDEALKEIVQNRGVLYDANVVDACQKVVSQPGFKLEE